LDDVEMARKAISRMEEKDIYHLGSTKYGQEPTCSEDFEASGVLWDGLSLIRPEWHLPFMKLLSPDTDLATDIPPHGANLPVQFLNVRLLTGQAKSFDPVPYQSRRSLEKATRKRKRNEEDCTAGGKE
jgi:hypothetical protein